ncbi:MAG: hypothetical protein KC535_04875 [Nanoarchaeota archaeon]|nr:hypothetical protein [Nanoarchaeota archaeon]
MSPDFFLPPDFGIEVLYTVLIMIFTFLVFYKTREIYELTKHKGVQFFRYAFILLGLAYASRLFLYGSLLKSSLSFEPFSRPSPFLAPVSSLLLAYFSTLAILYLLYSTIWREYKTEHFLTIANSVALLISIIAFISRSPLAVLLSQVVLLVALVVMNIRNHKGDKKKTPMYALYFLIALFWLVSLLVMSGMRIQFSLWLKLVLEAISLSAMVVLYYKISRWVR